MRVPLLGFNSGISMKVRVRYADFLTLLSIFKDTVNVNENSSGKCEIQVLLLDF